MLYYRSKYSTLRRFIINSIQIKLHESRLPSNINILSNSLILILLPLASKLSFA